MRLRRQATVLVLTSVLATPLAATAYPHPDLRDKSEHPAVNVSEFLSHAWSLFTGVWHAARACDEGSGMDPLGCPAQPTTDEGPGADPLG